jgi:hypothetical protein
MPTETTTTARSNARVAAGKPVAKAKGQVGGAGASAVVRDALMANPGETVDVLARAARVSVATARRALIAMASEGTARRLRGGHLNGKRVADWRLRGACCRGRRELAGGFRRWFGRR